MLGFVLGNYGKRNKYDGDVIYAVIIDRYCPELLKFKIQGGRGFSEDALRRAKEINSRYPFNIGLVHDEDFSVNILSEKKQEIEYVQSKTINDYYMNAFLSEETYSDLVSLYGQKLYDHVLSDCQRRRYFSLQLVHTVLSICKIYSDVKINRNLLAAPADYFENIGRIPAHIDLLTSNLLEYYITARFDIKNFGDRDNSIKIENISDPYASVSTPEFFTTKYGKGQVLCSKSGKISFEIHCVGNGNLRLYLRSKYLMHENKRCLFCIDYSRLTVNDEELIVNTIPTTHDSPYIYEKKVTDGEIITIDAQWTPHDPRISV